MCSAVVVQGEERRGLKMRSSVASHQKLTMANWEPSLKLILLKLHSSVQFSSVAQSCPTLCNPMNCSMPGLPVHHQHPECTQTHAHRGSDAIQPSHPLSSPFPPAPIPPSIRVFSNESTLRMRWPKYWSFSSNYTRSCQRNQSTILWFLQPLKQIEKVKKFSKWVPHELTTNQKNCYLETPFSLILCNSNELFPDWIVMSNKKWVLYDNQWWPVQWLDWETPKHFPKPNLPPEKVMTTVWWSASRLIHYSFLNPCKIITS